MMVIFVSQCEKKALNRTRRVLDAFADRIGDSTWQTIITDEGLQAVKKMLRKTASKNTAVSCHWIRSRARSDLLWVVGRKNVFDYRGVVAVNRTKHNILHNEWENNWQYASSIQIIATLSALLHDIGKSTIGFQRKLLAKPKYGDPYRHEWISLKLFEAMITGCNNDNEWLERFQNIDAWLAENSLGNTLKKVEKDKANIFSMPPLAQWVAWLIVTHHRLPPFKSVFYKHKEKEQFKTIQQSIKYPLPTYFARMFKAFDYWVKNPKTLEDATQKFSAQFWHFDSLVIHSPAWQKHLKRWARKAEQDITLTQLSEKASNANTSIDDTFLLYLSRLSLMVGDHNYSSLPAKDKRCVSGSKDFETLLANTDRTTKEAKQTLDEHLIGVGTFTAKFARHLPVIASSLPTIKEQASLTKNTGIDRFKWQNKAFKKACELQETSEENGFFGINMASTGCGKTIGNARIMYALADPKKGARFTIALGLRVLTLQTGKSFREDLKLTKAQLAILVGGQAHKKLFDMQTDDDNQPEKIANEVVQFVSDTLGSESSEDLLSEMLDGEIDYQDYDELNLGTVIENPKARDLLFSPVVTCTVDHIIQASECKRGGKYIAPMLRLLSSDLILDEPDDFDHADLPALSRLVHLAGLFGSRILLSSATLTPDLVTGLFKAYQAGRQLYNQSQKKASPVVACAWFDENEKNITTESCQDAEVFVKHHHTFTKKRETFLAKQAVRRKADIMPLSLSYNKEQQETFYGELGQQITQGAWQLHQNHHLTEPQSQKHVSVGLVRIANIKNINQIAMQLFGQFDSANVPDDVHIHISCYHAKQLLVLRNSLETKLDRILKRDANDPGGLFRHAEIRHALNKSDTNHHIFIVLATPVAEVGRDHDYDWAIVEPSSMRSIIQLAGRIWRHRPDKVVDKTNMLILQYNIRWFTGQPKNPIFTMPGFESKMFKPVTYDVTELIPELQRKQIDARPRIINESSPSEIEDKKKQIGQKSKKIEINTLSQLEHKVMRHVLNNPQLNYVNAYWDNHSTANRLHTHLQQISEFRAGTPQEDWLLIPTDETCKVIDAFYAHDVHENTLAEATPHPELITHLEYEFNHTHISPWLGTSVHDALSERQRHEPHRSLRGLAISYASVSLGENQNGWNFHEFFGFIRN